MKYLARSKQCAKCPWKKNANPLEIANGYDVGLHKKLKKTIAKPGAIGGMCNAMACHESEVGNESYCIGWLVQQLGPGNNIGLRMRMRDYDLSKVRLDGEQHDRFEDTLP